MEPHSSPASKASPPLPELTQTLTDSDFTPGLKLDLWIRDPEVVRAVEELPEGRQRNDFVRRALRIGVLALQGAQGQIDVAAVRGESEHLVDRVGSLFSQHEKSLEGRLAATLREYFDPQTGRVNERFQELLKGGGELQRVVESVFANAAGTLHAQLDAQLGPKSAFAQLLAPEESNTLVSLIRTSVDAVIRQQHDAFVGQFTLDRPDSALARLVDAVARANKYFTDNIEGSVTHVLKEFSLDQPDSALSRLVHQVGEAQRRISAEFSLDADGSALTRLKRGLESALEDMRNRNEAFHRSVSEALAAMAARREATDTSPRHGLDFEEAGYQFIQERSQRLGDVPERVGSRTGLIKNNKKGDCLVTIGPESAGAGVRIVYEMKQDASYDLGAALQEIEEARRNRDAEIGVFVFSRRTAPPGLQSFNRYKRDLVVVWDAESEVQDAFLEAAIHCARALAVSARATRSNAQTDFTRINKALAEIQRQAESLEEVTTASTTIRSGAERILRRAEIMKEAFIKQLAVLAEEFTALRASGSMRTMADQ